MTFQAALEGDRDRVVAIEVKKLERTMSSKVARASDLVAIRGFSRFVCVEEQPGYGPGIVAALARRDQRRARATPW